jgi:hypothetical protein
LKNYEKKFIGIIMVWVLTLNWGEGGLGGNKQHRKAGRLNTSIVSLIYYSNQLDFHISQNSSFHLYNLPLTKTISTPITFLIVSTSELVKLSGLTTIK